MTSTASENSSAEETGFAGEENEYADLPPLRDDTRAPTRIGLALILFGFCGFLAWSVLAPLDEGVPLQGLVSLDTKRKTVQHPTGGIIESVQVQEAQIVKAGDVLMTLNASNVKAGYENARQRLLGQLALESRLLAEQAARPHITFQPELANHRDNPYIAELIATQEQLFNSRRATLRSELGALDEAISGQIEVTRGLQQQISGRQQHLALLRDESASLRELVREGYAPLNRQRELERMVLESDLQLSELRSNLSRTQRNLAELRMRRSQREQEARREVDAQLAEIKRETLSNEERFHAAKEELERIQIRAPASGAVVGIAAQTIGGVIAPGARIMDIIPQDEKLVLEGRLPPNLVDRVKPGLKTEIRFSGFAHEPQLVVGGQIDSVAADLLNDANTGAYYLVRASLTEEGQKELGARQIKPGMPVEIIIKTGERTLLTYLLGPLLKRMSQALIEE